MNLNVWIIIFLFVSFHIAFHIVYDRNLIYSWMKFNLSVTDGTRQSVAYVFDHHKFDLALASAWLEKNAKLSIPHKPQKIKRPLILRFKSHTPFVNASIDYLHNLTKKSDKLSFNVSIMVGMRHLLQNKHQYGNFLNLATFTFHKQRSLYENANQLKKCISDCKKNGLQNNLQFCYNLLTYDIMINSWSFKNSKLDIVHSLETPPQSLSPDNGRIHACLCVYDKTWYVRYEKYENTLNHILYRIKSIQN